MNNPFEYPAYRLFVLKQAVGADLVYFDLFTATAGNHELLLDSVIPIVSGAVAVAGVVSVDLHLTRTTDVGTGGTAATVEGTNKAASTIVGLSGQPCPGTVTARLTPTGGATAGALLGFASVFTEETSDATYMAPLSCMVKHLNTLQAPVIVRPGTGIRVVQGAVASVGNIGFDVTFRLRQKG